LAKATNLRHAMRQFMDAFFDGVDAIVAPTVPIKVFWLLTGPPSVETLGDSSDGMCDNTLPLNVTGNPARSLPSGFGDYVLPVGVQIVARHFRDATAIRIAQALEQAIAQSRSRCPLRETGAHAFIVREATGASRWIPLIPED
jgi:Asp-tRNA(Asn)/Glu-tRNA(Gln) amidotransferase A subunit family amidase